jgi:hypothetical protein
MGVMADICTETVRSKDVADPVFALPYGLSLHRILVERILVGGKSGGGEVGIRLHEVLRHHHTRRVNVAFSVGALTVYGEWSLETGRDRYAELERGRAVRAMSKALGLLGHILCYDASPLRRHSGGNAQVGTASDSPSLRRLRQSCTGVGPSGHQLGGD